MKINTKRLIENIMVISIVYFCFFSFSTNLTDLLHFTMLLSIAFNNFWRIPHSFKDSFERYVISVPLLVLLLILCTQKTIIALGIMRTVSSISSMLFCEEFDNSVSLVFSLCLSYFYLPTAPIVAKNLKHVAKLSSILISAHTYLCKHGDITNLYGTLHTDVSVNDTKA